MTRKKPDLDKTLLLLTQLMQHLRVPPNDNEGEGGELHFFSQENLGGFRLSGKALQLYRNCFESLVALHQVNPSVQLLSKTAAEDLLQTTILRTLRPGRGQETESRATFERRLAREVRNLRDRLLAESRTWLVSVQIQGIATTSLPAMFGSVKFVRGDSDTGKSLADNLRHYDPRPRRVARKKIEEENQVRASTRTEIAAIFSTEAIATVSVSAFDLDAAQILGIEKIRRAIDILNFFASLTSSDRRLGLQRAFVGPEGERITLHSVVCQGDGDFRRLGNRLAGNNPLVMVDLASAKAKKLGLARAGEIFAREDPTDLDARILTALSWAGRATVAPRREEAFLWFAIALEALLTKPKARSGVTDRLRLRATRLIGRNPETRKKVFDLVGELYEVRSAIVHAGDSTTLTERDLETIKGLVQCALTVVLTEECFSSMRLAREFEQWFDEQLFS